MTRERAKYLLRNREIGGQLRFAFRRRGESEMTVLHADGITQDEHSDIIDVWLTMDGYTCYTDAVIRIAQHGEVAA